MGDFVGGMLKYLRRHSVPRLTIAGGFGKMVKLAQGHGDLHSARSQVDFDRLAEMAAPFGLDAATTKSANTALEVLEAADDSAPALGQAVANAALGEARTILDNDTVKLDLVIIRRDGKLLAEAR